MFGHTTRFPTVTHLVLRQIHNNSKLLEGVKEIVNRNPRNLERLRIGRKYQGYHLDVNNYTYWHKLVIVKQQWSVSAEVHHFENGPIVTASSNELSVKQQLYRPTDSAAYRNIGLVLADRCLQSGICMLFCPPDQKVTQKQKLLVDALEEGGILLDEYERYIDPIPTRTVWPEKTWETFE